MFVIVLSSLLLYNVICGWFFISHYLLLFVMFRICVVPRENVVELHLASRGPCVSGRAAIFPITSQWIVKNILKYTVIWGYRTSSVALNLNNIKHLYLFSFFSIFFLRLLSSYASSYMFIFKPVHYFWSILKHWTYIDSVAELNKTLWNGHLVCVTSVR